MRERTADVLVVGAGPTGLTLALWLRRLGVASVRVVDEALAPGATTRAFAIHARTLELHEQLGFGHEAVARGVVVERFHFWVGGRRAAELPFGRFGEGLSPFPFALALGQDEHERLLLEKLEAEGVFVERGTRLVSLERETDHVRAWLESEDGVEAVSARFVCGCDGAHSTVREEIGARFPGGTYSRVFFVADVEARGETADGDAHFCVNDEDFTLVFPVKRTGTKRLVGLVPEALEGDATDVRWEEIAAKAEAETRLAVTKVRWFSTYRVHHRVADRFKEGRVFLLGDAAHIHSPAGGQGLNTGVGDAANLAWKLALVLEGRGDERLLETYERERIAFARKLVATTDRLFEAMVSGSALGRFTRTRLVPLLGPALLRVPLIRRALFRRISQIGVDYRASPLSDGVAGESQGGDRLPWVPLDGRDDFEPLRSLDWQVHVHGEASSDLVRACGHRGVALEVFPWTEEAACAGFDRDAAYLVRPDGYVAVACNAGEEERLERFFDAWVEGRVSQPSS